MIPLAMKPLDGFENSVTYYVKGVALENKGDKNGANPYLSTFIHIAVDDKWKYLGLIGKSRSGGWRYIITDEDGVWPCGTALDGINAVLGAVS